MFYLVSQRNPKSIDNTIHIKKILYWVEVWCLNKQKSETRKRPDYTESVLTMNDGDAVWVVSEGE